VAITTGVFNQLRELCDPLLLAIHFSWRGFSKLSGDLQAVAIGAMNLCATLLAMTLIDKLGRKNSAADRLAGQRSAWRRGMIFFTQRDQTWLGDFGGLSFFFHRRASYGLYRRDLSESVRSKGRAWEALRIGS